MPKTEAQKRAQAKYQAKASTKEKYQDYHLRLHVEHDKDVIDRLEQVDKKTTYIKDLIRKDIEGQG